jgi:hypothetical protein
LKHVRKGEALMKARLRVHDTGDNETNSLAMFLRVIVTVSLFCLVAAVVGMHWS